MKNTSNVRRFLNTTLLISIASTYLTFAGGTAASPALHIFQTVPNSQIYTPIYLSRGVKVRSDKLYYRQNVNLSGSVLFDASQYGKNSVLLNAVLGLSNEVYVLANLQKGNETQSTLLGIDIKTKQVFKKVVLSDLGIDNVLPVPFTYDRTAKALKINASKGYSILNNTVSSESGFFWIGPMNSNTVKIMKSQLD